MRLALIGLVTVAAALAAGVQAFLREGDRRIARRQFPRLFVPYLGPMHCVRTRLGPLVHHESMVARASTAANHARQEPSSQSLGMIVPGCVP